MPIMNQEILAHITKFAAAKVLIPSPNAAFPTVILHLLFRPFFNPPLHLLIHSVTLIVAYTMVVALFTPISPSLGLYGTNAVRCD